MDFSDWWIGYVNKHGFQSLARAGIAREAWDAATQEARTSASIDRVKTQVAHIAGVAPIDQPYTGSFGSIMENVSYGPIAIQICGYLGSYLDAER